jgi:hypothetical protein
MARGGRSTCSQARCGWLTPRRAPPKSRPSSSVTLPSLPVSACHRKPTIASAGPAALPQGSGVAPPHAQQRRIGRSLDPHARARAHGRMQARMRARTDECRPACTRTHARVRAHAGTQGCQDTHAHTHTQHTHTHTHTHRVGGACTPLRVCVLCVCMCVGVRVCPSVSVRVRVYVCASVCACMQACGSMCACVITRRARLLAHLVVVVVLLLPVVVRGLALYVVLCACVCGDIPERRPSLAQARYPACLTVTRR